MLSEKKKNRCAADSGSSSYSVFRTAKQILPMQRQSRHFLPRITASVLQMGTVTVPQSPKPLPVHSYHLAAQGRPPGPASSNSEFNKRSLQSSKVNLQRALVCIKAENCIISRHVFKVRIIGQVMIYNRSIEGNGSLPK